MKSKITNVHSEPISLFAKIDDVDQKVEIPAGEHLIVDNQETMTIRVFKKRGFITVEPFSSEEIEKNDTKTMDENVDPNNDEVMDMFHTTKTNEVDSKEEIEKDIEHLQETLKDRLIDPLDDLNVDVDDEGVIKIVQGEVEKYIEDGYVKGEWSETEEQFLKDNYPAKGRKFCANKLNRNESSVQKKINSLGLKKKKKRKKRRRKP